MSLSSFFNLVEIRTKFASIIPFILGTVYSLYRYKSINLKNLLIMFISLLAFDMTTTAINNYCDYRKENKNNEYKEKENAIVTENIKESTVLTVIFTLLSLASILGIILTLNTNIVVLFIGGISFLVGILYTFGPVPISRMPLGELFSGLFMGFVIMFLSIYIHVYDKNIVSLVYVNGIMNININLFEVIFIFLISVPAMTGIANIMLANNICDMNKDAINNRYTLPQYIGKKNALKLFKVLYYIGYIDIVALVILRIAPVSDLLALITLIPVSKNIKLFCENPIKSKTFILAVKNFVLVNTAQIIFIGLYIVLR